MKELTEQQDCILNSVYELSVENDDERIPFGEVVLDLYLRGEWASSNVLRVTIFGLTSNEEVQAEESVFVYHSSFYRHIIFYKNYSYEKILSRLNKLVQDCKKQGLAAFEIIEEYFVMDCFGYVIYNPEDKKYVEIANKVKIPTCTWRFVDVSAIKADDTMFDERIEVIVRWDDNGIEQVFKGYWYITSYSFIKSKLEKEDPYYRRCIMLCFTFDQAKLEKQLDLTMRYLATKSMECRMDCLRHHFEYDGQLMFYER